MSGTAVLLATWNGARYLPEQLQSLAVQTDPDWRLLWRDDGSTDDTRAVMARFAAERSAGQVAQLAEPAGRLGVLRGFMALLAAAPADAARFAFCDQDDVWLPGKLARARDWLAGAGDGPALYCARQQLVDGALQPIGLSPLPQRPAGFGNALVQNIATGCTIVLNQAARNAVLAAPPPPEDTLHDWWCYLVVGGCGGRVLFDAEPALLYRQHGSNTVGAAAAATTRTRRALARGPLPFLRRLASHLDALAAWPGLTAEARAQVATLRGLRDAGLLRRWRLLHQAGVWRQGVLEDVLLRLWLLQRALP